MYTGARQRDNGGTDANDLYGQRLGTDGQVLGPAFVVLEAGAEQQWPVIAGDGEGQYLAPRVHGGWQDDRNGDWDVYGALFQPLDGGRIAMPTRV